MKRLRVLALMHEHLVPPESIKGMSQEEINPFRMEYDVLQALRRLGHEVIELGVGDELLPIRKAIEEHEPHTCFNLLTHFFDVGAYHAHVVSYLELLRAPYTGCNPRGLILAGDKGLSKKVLTYHRIRVPRFVVFKRGVAVKVRKGIRFPLFVKSVSEEASTGISQASVVRDEEALKQRVEFVHTSIGTDAIAEEYIEGRELNVAVLGNDRLSAFPPQELTFENLPEGSRPILTSRIKWDLAYQKKVGVMAGPVRDLTDAQRQGITRLGKRVFRALGLSGYARMDLRLAEDGTVFVIEANPNPDLCMNEDFAESAGQFGIPYDNLIQRIVNLGLAYTPAWKGR